MTLRTAGCAIWRFIMMIQKRIYQISNWVSQFGVLKYLKRLLRIAIRRENWLGFKHGKRATDAEKTTKVFTTVSQSIFQPQSKINQMSVVQLIPLESEKEAGDFVHHYAGIWGKMLTADAILLSDRDAINFGNRTIKDIEKTAQEENGAALIGPLLMFLQPDGKGAKEIMAVLCYDILSHSDLIQRQPEADKAWGEIRNLYESIAQTQEALASPHPQSYPVAIQLRPPPLPVNGKLFLIQGNYHEVTLEELTEMLRSGPAKVIRGELVQPKLTVTL